MQITLKVPLFNKLYRIENRVGNLGFFPSNALVTIANARSTHKAAVGKFGLSDGQRAVQLHL